MNYIIDILTWISIYSLIGLSMNYLLGYLGILYLGHPAIYGIGAYGFAIAAQNGINYFVALLIGTLAAGFAAFLLSLPALRLKSHYIGMTTLAFLITVNGLIINLRDLTRGALGIPGIPRPTLFGYTLNSNLSFFLFTLTISLIVGYIFYRITQSPFTKVIEAIREDETSAKTLGKNHIVYKIKTFIITGLVGGLAGGLLASKIGYINHANFSTEEMITALAVVIVGGMGSFWGSILGAAIITIIPEPFRFLDLPEQFVGSIRFAIYGLLIILFMIYRPNGILGKRTNTFSK